MTGSELLIILAGELAERVASRYRVTEEDAVKVVLEVWSRRSQLQHAAVAAGSVADLRRTRIYRDAADAAKREIYQRLRRYRPQSEVSDQALCALAGLASGAPAFDRQAAAASVAAAHVSTAERLGHLDSFFTQLTNLIGAPTNVVDVGAGVLPLIAPLDDRWAAVREYWALEKDPAAVTALQEYQRVRADNRLHTLAWNLADGWAAAHQRGLPEHFKVGLVLKVVPVVARQEPSLLSELARVPADRLVVSGSRVAMAKRHDIEWRETRLLRKFFHEHGLRELAGFRTDDEVVFLTERG